MKKILYLSVLALLSSCLTEKNADPGKPSTFVRYYNGGNDDFAKVAEETSDKGIIILGTTQITNENLSKTFKIKLVKTDEYGNVVWQNVYPDFTNNTESLYGRALLQLDAGGFVVIGESILADGKTNMHILEVGTDGKQVASTTIDFGAIVNNTLSVQGQAIQINSNGNYLVLGSIQDETDNMILAELTTNLNSPTVTWVKKYGAGTSTLSNKIFLDASNNVFWSGTVIRNSADMRLVKTAQNSLNTLFDLPIGTPNFEEEGMDICRYGYGFAVIGSTNDKDGVIGDKDILFKVLAEDGTELLSQSIEGYSDTDIGNSISSVRGGIAILGTVRVGGQDDYLLMKYDAFGNSVWPEPRVFGNKTKNDIGASVRQMSDGSLLVLGTTLFGNVNTMMLMKADSEGNIE